MKKEYDPKSGLLIKEPEKKKPKVDPPKVDPPKVDPPKVDPPKVDPPKVDPPKVDPPKVDPPKVDPPVVDPPKVDPPVVDPPVVDPPVVDPVVDPPKVDPPKVDPPKDKKPFEKQTFKDKLYIEKTKSGDKISPDSVEDLRQQIKEIEVTDPTDKAPSKPLIETGKRGRKKKSDSFVIEGYVLMMIIDTFIPTGISFLNNMFNRKVKISMDQIQLSNNQFKQLEPIADQAAKYLAFNINPIAGFFIVSTIFYANNFVSSLTADKIEFVSDKDYTKKL